MCTWLCMCDLYNNLKWLSTLWLYEVRLNPYCYSRQSVAIHGWTKPTTQYILFCTVNDNYICTKVVSVSVETFCGSTASWKWKLRRLLGTKCSMPTAYCTGVPVFLQLHNNGSCIPWHLTACCKTLASCSIRQEITRIAGNFYRKKLL